MTHPLFIDIQDIRVGMYIQLDLSWLRHPFPVGSFRISNADQIRSLQTLGISSIRCIPAKSDEGVLDELLCFTKKIECVPLSGEDSASFALPDFDDVKNTLLVSQCDVVEAPCLTWSESSVLQDCDLRFSAATQGYLQVMGELELAPGRAKKAASDLVAGYIAELLDSSETTIRLLSENVGEQQGVHPVNVTLLSLMLGKACGLNAHQLLDLGLAALVHDIGKAHLPPRCRESFPSLRGDQHTVYESHVAASVALGQRMGLSISSLMAIAQHHELADGSGFPRGLVKEDLSQEGQILALANCYEKLCNPSMQSIAMTPHEALSALFAQRRGAFARELVELFVRVLGVYPPGTLVQLSDGRFGIVHATRTADPLKPSVLIYHPELEKSAAEPVNLAELDGVVVKRSMRPSQLSRDVLDYLSPRKRVCYFFERAVPLAAEQGRV